jgi:hypothetical protein
MKAVLVNSAVPMRAYRFQNGTSLTLGLPPDAFQVGGDDGGDSTLFVTQAKTG